MASSNSKTKILDCAERIVVRDGVARLTMDAVAAEAGLSKGGVLYNFPSKDDLIRALLFRLMEEFEAEMARLVKADPEPRGRLLRAYLTASFPPDEAACQHNNQVAGSLLAAILTNRALLAPLQKRFRETQQRLLEDGLDPAHVHLVWLAADGLWMGDLLGTPGPDAQARREVIQHLFEFTRI